IEAFIPRKGRYHAQLFLSLVALAAAFASVVPSRYCGMAARSLQRGTGTPTAAATDLLPVVILV
ncbi:hypothetical protein ACWCOZ_34445, partial [Streptomyces sp. NPDC001840]